MQVDDFDSDDLLNEIDLGMLEAYIRTAILPHFPPEAHDVVFKRAKALGLKYDWYDSMNAMDVLGVASQKGCFTEFVERLEDEYERNFRYVSENATVRTPQKVKENKNLFLEECMRALDDRNS